MISLVGSVSATFYGYFTPGFVILKHRGPTQGSLSSKAMRTAAYATMALGAFIFVNGFVTLYIRFSAASAPNSDSPDASRTDAAGLFQEGQVMGDGAGAAGWGLWEAVSQVVQDGVQGPRGLLSSWFLAGLPHAQPQH